MLPGQQGGDPWSPNYALGKPGDMGDSGQCQWRPNGPLLYNLEHSKMHADGEDYREMAPKVAWLFWLCPALSRL